MWTDNENVVDEKLGIKFSLTPQSVIKIAINVDGKLHNLHTISEVERLTPNMAVKVFLGHMEVII